MRLYAALIYLFLYGPVALIVFFSFNAGRYAMDWQGFSLEWYPKAFSNPLITEALLTSLGIALTNAVLASIIGTLAALGLERMTGWLRGLFDALVDLFLQSRNWPFGAAVSVALVAIMFVTIAVYMRFVLGRSGQKRAALV